MTTEGAQPQDFVPRQPTQEGAQQALTQTAGKMSGSEAPEKKNDQTAWLDVLRKRDAERHREGDDADKTTEAAEQKPQTEDVTAERTEPKREEKPDKKGSRESDDYRKARENLKLRKYAEESLLDQLDPDAVVSMWTRVAERESDIDAAFRERAELKKQLEELSTKQPATTEQKVPTVEPDFSKPLDHLVEELALSDEGRKALEGMLKAVADPLVERVQSAEKVLQEQSARTEKQLLTTARSRLNGEFPALADEGDFARVRATMDEISGRKKYREMASVEDAVAELMRDSARLEGLEYVNGSAKAAESELETTTDHDPDRERSEAQPTTRTNRRPKEPIVGEAAERWIYQYQRKNPDWRKTMPKAAQRAGVVTR